MGQNSKIEWTDDTWNPVTGCTRVSEGCRNCYMARTVPRQGIDPWTVVLHPDRMNTPINWKRPRRIFVNSLSDLFHEKVPDYFIEQVYKTMCQASHHTYQILTKRPKRMLDWISRSAYLVNDPPANVWLGVSIENQATADERIPILLQTPAAVRFVSAEPLLGPVDISRFMWPLCWHWASAYKTPKEAIAAGAYAEKKRQALVSAHCRFLDWVIVGGESGPGARPMHPDWPRSIRDQCQSAGVPFFFKQWGEWKPISEMSEAETNALYVSNRKAREHEDQANIDDCYGRRCRKPSAVIRHDGALFGITDQGAFELRDGRPAMTVFKVGKKSAGAMLDGREHKEWPR